VAVREFGVAGLGDDKVDAGQSVWVEQVIIKPGMIPPIHGGT
jgi:hypothetical protein